jgi:hypothetical protein
VASDGSWPQRASMTRKFLARLFVIITLALGAASIGDAAGSLSLFPTEQEAQQHCPLDTVAWLNLPTGIYHFKGQRWYGRTKTGAYVCKQEADQAGDRPSLNGQ